MLGTGTLPHHEPGRRDGTATFPIRGEFPLVLDLLTRTDKDETARFRVGPWVGQVMRFRGNAMADEPVRFWHGHMTIDGYQMRVRIVEGSWGVEFHDRVQRDAARWQVSA